MRLRHSLCATSLLITVVVAAGGCDADPELPDSEWQSPEDAGSSADGPQAKAVEIPRKRSDDNRPGMHMEPQPQALITFPCGVDDNDGNHMNAKPASDCSNGMASDTDSRRGMEFFQRFRKHIKLRCLETPGYAQAAAGWHAIYMSEHASALSGHSDCFVDGHHEKPGCTYFSGVTPRDQLVTNGMEETDRITGQDTGEAIACRMGSDDFFAGMLAAPYHRQALMNPQTDFGGFATFWQNHAGFETWANVITMSGRVARDGADPELVVYPVPGDTQVPRWFSGREVPGPPAPPQGFPSGYPISIYGRPGMVWESTELCELSPINRCILVPHVALLSSSDPHVLPWAGHLYSHVPLKSGQRYEARFYGTRDGVAWKRAWRFKTKL
jgi:hypothetical protein